MYSLVYIVHLADTHRTGFHWFICFFSLFFRSLFLVFHFFFSHHNVIKKSDSCWSFGIIKILMRILTFTKCCTIFGRRAGEILFCFIFPSISLTPTYLPPNSDFAGQFEIGRPPHWDDKNFNFTFKWIGIIVQHYCRVHHSNGVSFFIHNALALFSGSQSPGALSLV